MNYPCRDTNDRFSQEQCRCPKRQYSEISNYATAIDLTYGTTFQNGTSIMVSLSEPSFSHLLRGEALYQGRVHMRTCQRKYLYFVQNHDDPRCLSIPALEKTGIKRLLKTFFKNYYDAGNQSFRSFSVRTLADIVLVDDTVKSSLRARAITATEQLKDPLISLLAGFFDSCANSSDPNITKLITDLCGLGVSNGNWSLDELVNCFEQNIKPFFDAKFETFDEDIRAVIGNACAVDVASIRSTLSDCTWNNIWPSIESGLRSALRCHPLNNTGNSLSTENFIGFVDLRPIAETSPIAMALLAPPTHLCNDNHHVITGRYSYPFCPSFDHLLNYAPALTADDNENAYDFFSTSEDGWKSSFYVMNDAAHISGAACAQASIVMATGLLADLRPDYEFANDGASILSPYEATFLAHKKTDSSIISTLALIPQQVCDVLKTEEARANAFYHEFDIGTERDDEYFFNLAKGSFFLERTFESLLNANFPIILFCDNNHLSEKTSPNCEDTPHCVVINGYERVQYEDGKSDIKNKLGYLPYFPTRLERLVIHDPGTAPFLRFRTGHCFFAASRYDSENEKRTCHFVIAVRKEIVVSPWELITSLWDGEVHNRISPENASQLALFSKKLDDYISELIESAESIKTPNQPHTINQPQYDFSLSLISADEIIELLRGAIPGLDNIPENLSRDHFWVVQLFKEEDDGGKSLLGLCVRNAEIESENIFDCCLFFEFGGNNENFDVGGHNENLKKMLDLLRDQATVISTTPILNNQGVTDALTIQKSLLTSSSGLLFEELLAKAEEEGFDAIELFLRTRDLEQMLRDGVKLIPDTADLPDSILGDIIQEKEIDNPPDTAADYRIEICTSTNPSRRNNLLAPLLKKGYLSVVDFLCEDTNIDNIVPWLSSALDKHQLNISAIATYFPQIALEEDSPQREKAIKALKNSLLLGARLHNKFDNGNVIVEAVAGSILLHVEDEENTHVRIRDRNEVISHVYQGFAKVLSDYDSFEHPSYERIAIAIEMEPGIEYVLNDIEAVKILAERIKADGNVRMGLNFDVGHYMSLRDQETLFQTMHDIRPYIVHSHVSAMVSRTGRHYRDMPLNRCSEKEKSMIQDFLGQYLLAMNERQNAPDNLRIISGYTSLELEGCPTWQWISDSIEEWETW